MKCGHQEPSTIETSLIANSDFPMTNQYELILKEDDSANGRWTMVYDEGFNVEVGEYSFFAFSKYKIEKSVNRIKIIKSMCYSTLVGWYVDKLKTSRGCFKAEKKGIDINTVTYYNTQKDGMDINVNFNIPIKILKMSFKEQQIYVDNLNSNNNKNWLAGIYNKYNNILPNLRKFVRKLRPQLTTNKKFLNLNLSKFPKNFNWLNLITPSINQGDCGSCYAIATVKMMEARLKLLYNHNINLSVQHVLDCSYYNQGCNGGYPFLAMKFGNEFEILPENCKPYLATNGKCLDSSCDKTKLQFSYKFKDFGYLGGSYGKCNEELMMQELYKNGPFVVSFNPDYNFMFYKKGIYHKIDLDLNINNDDNNNNWEKVDQSVLLVGWGVDDLTGEKFWLIQNSLGPYWGENGFFRIIRGYDELAIESMCESGTPIIIDNITQLSLLPFKNNLRPQGLNTIIKKNIILPINNVSQNNDNFMKLIYGNNQRNFLKLN